MKKQRQLIFHHSYLQLNVDGEYGGKLPANFSKSKCYIDVFAPNDIVNEELINNDHVDDNLIEE
ncbi:hypothetical protein ACVPOS_15465 [Staphylococcus aureus]